MNPELVKALSEVPIAVVLVVVLGQVALERARKGRPSKGGAPCANGCTAGPALTNLLDVGRRQTEILERLADVEERNAERLIEVLAITKSHSR